MPIAEPQSEPREPAAERPPTHSAKQRWRALGCLTIVGLIFAVATFCLFRSLSVVFPDTGYALWLGNGRKWDDPQGFSYYQHEGGRSWTVRVGFIQITVSEGPPDSGEFRIE